MKLGITGPFSGERKAYGNLIKSSTDVIKNKMNSTVLFEFKDDQASVKIAEQVAHSFIEENVTAVIGHFNSLCAKAVAKIYHNHQITFIAPASTSIYIPYENDGYVYRTCPTNLSQISKLVDYCKSNLISIVGIVTDDSAYANELSLLSEIELLKHNIKIEYICPFEIHKNLDLVWFIGTHYNCIENCESILKYITHKIPFIFCDDCFVDEFIVHFKKSNQRILIIGLSPNGYIDIYQNSLQVLINHLENQKDLIFKKEYWQIHELSVLNV